MPEWTAADIAGLVSGASTAKLAQTIHHVAWYEFCECISAPQPTPPTVNPPADLPTLQPSPLGACDTAHGEFEDDAQWGTQYLVGSATTWRALPVGATSLQATGTIIAQGSGSGDTRTNSFGIRFYDVNSTLITPPPAAMQVGPTTGATLTWTVSVPANAVKWNADTICQPGGGPCPAGRSVTFDVTVHCGGTPDRLQPACCPPDPQLVAKVDSLLELVTLIQRQHVPFAYVPEGESTGLTGNGEVAVSGLLAVTVLLTTLPGHFGMAEGSPDAIFDVGWIAVGTDDGFEPARPIRTSPMFVRVSGDVTRIGYSLSPGVVATIKRHVREP